MKGFISLVTSVLLFSFIHASADVKPYALLRTDWVKETAGNLDQTPTNANANGPTGTVDSSKYVGGINETTSGISFRRTKVGAKMAESFDGADVKGKFEADFMGDRANSNSITAQPRIVYAFVDLHEKMFGSHFLAGQADDIVAPLKPNTYNDGGSKMSGNVGYRRTQMQLNKELFDMLKFELSAAKPYNDREKSGQFDYAGRLSFDTKDMWPVQAMLGYGYVYGKDLRTDGGTKLVENLVQVKALDLSLKGYGFQLNGEYYWGTNSDDYMGMQGYDTSKLTSLKETGWWTDLTYSRDNYSVTYGHSQAKLDEGGGGIHPGVMGLERNERKWANFTYNLEKDFKIGFEYSVLKSTWTYPSLQHDTSGKNLGLSSERYNLVLTYAL